TLSGAVSATATHHGKSETKANSDALGANAAVGVSLALAFVDDSATATTHRDVTAGGAVGFSAHADGSSLAQAKGSAAGADTTDEAASGKNTADQQAGSAAGLANQKSGGTNSVGKSADTDENSSGGSVSVAAALAVNVSHSDALASVGDGVTVVAGNGAGT